MFEKALTRVSRAQGTLLHEERKKPEVENFLSGPFNPQQLPDQSLIMKLTA
jgi:hypothetical protein